MLVVYWIGTASLQKFVNKGKLEIGDNTPGRRRLSIKFTGKLSSAVASMKQGLEESGEDFLSAISKFLLAEDGEMLLSRGQAGMQGLCFFRGQIYLRSRVKFFVFSITSFLWFHACSGKESTGNSRLVQCLHQHCIHPHNGLVSCVASLILGCC